MPFVNPQSHIFRNVYDNIFIQLDAVMTVACDDIITLNAILVGDTADHTFRWEQMSGTPVTWLESQNQQVVMFQQPAVRDDKVFKFTLDANTNIAKEREILVTAIPTDLVKTYIKYTKGSEESGLFINDAFSDLMPAFRPAGSAVLNDTERSMLLVNSKIVGNNIDVVQILNGQDIHINTRLFSDTTVTSVILDGLYVDKTYKFVSRNLYESSSTIAKSYSSLNFSVEPDLAVSDSDTLVTSVNFAPGLNSVVETITRSVETTVTDDADHTVSTSVQFVSGLNEVVESITRQLLIDDNSEDVLTSSVSFTSGLQSVVEVKAFQYSSLG